MGITLFLQSSDVDEIRKTKHSTTFLFQEAVSNQTPTGATEFSEDDTKIFLVPFKRLLLGPTRDDEDRMVKGPWSAAYTLSERLVILGLISIISQILFAFWFSGTDSRRTPHSIVSSNVGGFQDGDFNVDIQVEVE